MIKHVAMAAALGLVAQCNPVLAVGDFQLLDDGTGSRMCATDGNRHYVLKDNGNVWENAFGQWNQIDDGTGTRQLCADSGYVYVLKNDGSVFRRAFGQWQRIGNAGSRQMVAAGQKLFTLETNDDVFEYSGGFFNPWTKIDNGTNTRMITADRQGNTYVMKNSGQIFRHLGWGRWEMTDDGQGSQAMHASDGRLYVLKNNGNIWRNWGGWRMIDDGTGTKQIVGDGQFFHALKNNGNTWMFSNERWTMSDNGTGTRMIDAKDGDLLVMKDNGNIYKGSAFSFPQAPGNSRESNFNALHGN